MKMFENKAQAEEKDKARAQEDKDQVQ